MSVEIEKGTARCPRCMVLADYSFHEDGGGVLRYQVTCRACDHVHTELCALSSVA